MTAFRSLLIALIALILIYTAVTVSNHGVDFITPYFTGLLAFDWQGQFNLDFGMFLLLTGLWVAWRNGFTPGSIVVGATAPVLGIPLLAGYLLWLSYRPEASLRRILLGVHADT